MKITKKIFSEISAGELLDKISILEIKKNKIKDKKKNKNVRNELSSLLLTAKDNNLFKRKNISKAYKNLKKINEKLWKIEDEIRDCERNKNFNDKFIFLARSVYINNDLRAKIKNSINTSADSNIKEVKSYKKY
ncbi:MAG: DUF6165 family protein [Candidatus Fonsibacter sp.]